jgi:hypothetical protein
MSLAIASSYKASSPLFNDTGVSDAAIVLKGVFDTFLEDRTESIYLKRKFSLPESVLNELSDIESECRFDNWDEEDASKVAKTTISKAKELLLSLPKALQSPDIEAEINGSISFEWYKTNKLVFVVMINELGVLKYAGLFGPIERRRGTSYFDGFIPEDILAMIKKVYA